MGSAIDKIMHGEQRKRNFDVLVQPPCQPQRDGYPASRPSTLHKLVSA